MHQLLVVHAEADSRYVDLLEAQGRSNGGLFELVRMCLETAGRPAVLRRQIAKSDSAVLLFSPALNRIEAETAIKRIRENGLQLFGIRVNRLDQTRDAQLMIGGVEPVTWNWNNVQRMARRKSSR